MRRLFPLFSLLYLSLLLMAGCKPNPPKKDNNSIIQESKVEPQKLNVNEFEIKLTATPDAQLVDVRTPEEYSREHLKGAINIDYQGSGFMDGVAKLDKTKPVFVYCQMGGRSSEACEYMSNQGFKEIYNMDNGMSSWLHYNKPVEGKQE